MVHTPGAQGGIAGSLPVNGFRCLGLKREGRCDATNHCMWPSAIAPGTVAPSIPKEGYHCEVWPQEARVAIDPYRACRVR